MKLNGRVDYERSKNWIKEDLQPMIQMMMKWKKISIKLQTRQKSNRK